MIQKSSNPQMVRIPTLTTDSSARPCAAYAASHDADGAGCEAGATARACASHAETPRRRRANDRRERPVRTHGRA
ncbi:hypothetical protein FFM54_33585 [Burkholderia pseudomallei]|nr:hypothetical protein FFM54_33585 [Burkholderia pseudomallei]